MDHRITGFPVIDDDWYLVGNAIILLYQTDCLRYATGAPSDMHSVVKHVCRTYMEGTLVSSSSTFLDVEITILVLVILF